MTKCFKYATIMLLDISRGIIVEKDGMDNGGTSAMTEATYYILLALMKPGHGYGHDAAHQGTLRRPHRNGSRYTVRCSHSHE